jgi:hypothetical protein
MHKNNEIFTPATIIWIIGVIVTVGLYIGIIQNSAQAITELRSFDSAIDVRIDKIEICLTKLTTIDNDINQIKTDLRDIKGIIYRPVIKNDNGNNK